MGMIRGRERVKQLPYFDWIRAIRVSSDSNYVSHFDQVIAMLQ
jgi:hypothetical protein